MMSLLKKLKFWEKKPEPKRLIIERTLPPIDSRIPLVRLDTPDPIAKQTGQIAAEDLVRRSCALCKFALHDPNLRDDKTIICTVDPNKPEEQKMSQTCGKHEAKYPNLKVIVDKGTLLEYDSEKSNSRRPRTGHESSHQDTGIEEIGEQEWQA